MASVTQKTEEKIRNLQQLLNKYGFTDSNGDMLKLDGVIGPKTKAAMEKFNRYQKESKNPSNETRYLQRQLNGAGYKDAAGLPLKTDGVWGPKTDALNNRFENDFYEGMIGDSYKKKTVQKQAFPAAPKMVTDIKRIVLPKEKDAENKIGRTGINQTAKPFAADAGQVKIVNSLLAQISAKEQRKPAQKVGRNTDDDFGHTGIARIPNVIEKQNLPTFDNTYVGRLLQNIQNIQNKGGNNIQKNDKMVYNTAEGQFVNNIKANPAAGIDRTKIDFVDGETGKELPSIFNSKPVKSGSMNWKPSEEDGTIADQKQNLATEVQDALDDKKIVDIMGMHFDRDKNIWYSTSDNIREKLGYGDIYDMVAPALGFDLNTGIQTFNYDGKEFRFQVWNGTYGPDSTMPGAESGLYCKGDEETKEGETFIEWVVDSIQEKSNIYPSAINNEIGMEVELYDRENNQILKADSADYEGDTYWQFASKLTAGKVDKKDLYMMGTLTSDKEGLLDALKAAGAGNKNIEFYEVVKDESYSPPICKLTYKYVPDSFGNYGVQSSGGGGGGGTW